MKRILRLLIGGLLASIFISGATAAESGSGTTDMANAQRLEAGRKMYLEGVLPSGELMSAVIQGDISVTGEQVICGTCHRRSGMGSTEGQQVVPAVSGKMLLNPLQLPTSQKESAPILRLAYTRDSLKTAIRTGVDANGKRLDPMMPRYPLDDEALDLLIDYLSSISNDFSPGVDDRDMHFATVVSDGVDAADKKALLDVMQTYIKQKNVETRHETERADHAPWHKEWMFKPYRKWVLHVWELKGAPDTWRQQLEAYYNENPVYAMLSGTVEGPWAPIHEFCQSTRLPCLFPTTDLPVIDESDFYSIYTDQGMTLDADGIVSHIRQAVGDAGQVVQFYPAHDLKAETAAKALALGLKGSGIEVQDVVLTGQTGELNDTQAFTGDRSVLVVWGDGSVLSRVAASIDNQHLPRRVYLTTRLFGVDPSGIPDAIVDRTYLVHSQEMPDKLSRLLLRSTGWFRSKRIYAPDAQRIQANAYFALKSAGGALKLARGYFYRDYFVEKIESMTDNANYTSVYPRISLAPDQRFISKGFYMTRPVKGDAKKLEAVTEWAVP